MDVLLMAFETSVYQLKYRVSFFFTFVFSQLASKVRSIEIHE